MIQIGMKSLQIIHSLIFIREMIKIGNKYKVKKDIFGFKPGDIIKLIDKGYQAYYGEYNFVFTDMENKNICVVLRGDDEDMKIYHHLNEYFEESDNNTNL